MTRTTTNINIGGGRVMARVRIVGDACQAGTLEARMEQYRLFRAVANVPDLTACALSPFESLRMFHDGTAWVVEAEATVKDPQGLTNASERTGPTT